MLRITSYNMLGMTGFPREEAEPVIGKPSSETNMQHFSKVLQELESDIIAIQEGVPAQTINRIAGAMGFNAATFVSPCYWPGHVLARYAILESRTFSHSSPKAESRPLSRCAGAALLQINDDLLWVLNLHLYPHAEEAHRRDEESPLLLRQVQRLLQETPNLIILGDFNSNVQETFHQELRKAGFTNALAETASMSFTIPSIGSGRDILDHIYLSPSVGSRLVTAHVVKDRGFHAADANSGTWVHSDHLPVKAELNWSSSS